MEESSPEGTEPETESRKSSQEQFRKVYEKTHEHLVELWNENPEATFQGGTRAQWISLLAEMELLEELPHYPALEDLEEISQLAHESGYWHIGEQADSHIMETHNDLAEIVVLQTTAYPNLSERLPVLSKEPKDQIQT